MIYVNFVYEWFYGMWVVEFVGKNWIDVVVFGLVMMVWSKIV